MLHEAGARDENFDLELRSHRQSLGLAHILIILIFLYLYPVVILCTHKKSCQCFFLSIIYGVALGFD
jgi:hypothetical protein